MSITLAQGILISLWAFIAGIDFWLEGLYLFRPIIVCTITGLILGDLRLGLIAGGLTELVFAGLTPVGGTQPPNPIMAGIMTVVIAYTSGHSAATAIGLSLPFSILMQYIILFFYSAFSLLTKKADDYADKADTQKFTWWVLWPTFLIAIVYAIFTFLCVYAAQKPMSDLVNLMPQWLSHGFQIAGGILPAVGFGMLLNNMLHVKYVPFLLLGFTAACFIKFGNLMPVAVIGLALALIEYFHQAKEMALEKHLKQVEENDNGGENDGI